MSLAADVADVWTNTILNSPPSGLMPATPLWSLRPAGEITELNTAGRKKKYRKRKTQNIS